MALLDPLVQHNGLRHLSRPQSSPDLPIKWLPVPSSPRIVLAVQWLPISSLGWRSVLIALATGEAPPGQSAPPVPLVARRHPVAATRRLLVEIYRLLDGAARRPCRLIRSAAVQLGARERYPTPTTVTRDDPQRRVGITLPMVEATCLGIFHSSVRYERASSSPCSATAWRARLLGRPGSQACHTR